MVGVGGKFGWERFGGCKKTNPKSYGTSLAPLGPDHDYNIVCLFLELSFSLFRLKQVISLFKIVKAF